MSPCRLAHHSAAVDATAGDLAAAVLDGSLHPSRWNHTAFVFVTIRLVHDEAGSAALDRLRTITAAYGLPAAASIPGGQTGPHETLAVFFAWAVQRLLGAGLSTTEVLWHPLVGATAPLAWYDPATLASVGARERFVASDRVLPGEPAPSLPA